MDKMQICHFNSNPIVCSPKPALASRFEGKSMTKFWVSIPWFFQNVDLDSEGIRSLVISWRRPDAHAGKIIPTHSEHYFSPTPSQCFWQDIYFPAFDTFSADSFCSESAFLHTKRHKWPWLNIFTSWQILVGNGHRSYGWFSLSPVTDRNIKDFLNSR